VRFLRKLTAAVYIKLYKRHDYPMKSGVTNVQYYNIDNKPEFCVVIVNGM
jgi:hypothetical protein